MVLLIIGYIMGVIHKMLYNYDIVTYLYLFNMLLVTVDLMLYLRYIDDNRKTLVNAGKKVDGGK